LHQVSLWKIIRGRWDSFSRHLKFTIGDGTWVRLWLDLWCGDHYPKHHSPSLFNLAVDMNVSIALYLGNSNDRGK